MPKWEMIDLSQCQGQITTDYDEWRAFREKRGDALVFCDIMKTFPFFVLLEPPVVNGVHHAMVVQSFGRTFTANEDWHISIIMEEFITARLEQIYDKTPFLFFRGVFARKTIIGSRNVLSFQSMTSRISTF